MAEIDDASLLTFNEATRAAARIAANACQHTMREIGESVHDEDDVTPMLVSDLQHALHDQQIGGLTLKATVLRHRAGKAAEERRYGADLLIHVGMDTPIQKYSKGVLIQAKKPFSTGYMSQNERKRLEAQCQQMLSTTPAAFVFSYGSERLRCGAATRVAGGIMHQGLNELCGWTSYRFFLELFRCPIGDPRITSHYVRDLPPPIELELSMVGQLKGEPGIS